jgi:hypothetical protein
MGRWAHRSRVSSVVPVAGRASSNAPGPIRQGQKRTVTVLHIDGFRSEVEADRALADCRSSSQARSYVK